MLKLGDTYYGSAWGLRCFRSKIKRQCNFLMSALKLSLDEQIRGKRDWFLVFDLCINLPRVTEDHANCKGLLHPLFNSRIYLLASCFKMNTPLNRVRLISLLRVVYVI